MKQILAVITLAVMLFTGCSKPKSYNSRTEKETAIQNLQDSLQTIADSYPAEIGVAVITDSGDTILVNNTDKYPLMSVFKLHQAISLCHLAELKGWSIDSVAVLQRKKLNPDTWSPMLKDFSDSVISLPVTELLRYTLMQSDNNASNYLFDKFEKVSDVDSFIATIIPRESFRLAVTEADMWSDHSLCYRNHSSPLGAAILMDRLFTDSIIGSDNSNFIRTALLECKTGTDRIVAPLKDKEGVTVAHKTGSGFRNENGILSAHNDVAFVQFGNRRHYTLAVLVKDFNGSETEAAKAIARISAAVYTTVSKQL